MISYNYSEISISIKSENNDITSVEISILGWPINQINVGNA